MGIAFMAMTALLMLLWPRLLIGAFLDLADPDNAAVVELAVTFLAFAACSRSSTARRRWLSGMLRGLHDTAADVYAALGYWGIGLPLGVVLAFPFGFDGAGIWIGLASGLAVVPCC